jgi:hypothetical protein
MIEIKIVFRAHWTVILHLLGSHELRFPEKWVIGIVDPCLFVFVVIGGDEGLALYTSQTKDMSTGAMISSYSYKESSM